MKAAFSFFFLFFPFSEQTGNDTYTYTRTHTYTTHTRYATDLAVRRVAPLVSLRALVARLVGQWEKWSGLSLKASWRLEKGPVAFERGKRACRNRLDVG